jgi:hypothetical protein
MATNALIEQPLRQAGVGKGRIPLTSLAGVLTEAARIYRKMKAGKINHEEGRSLVWVLSQMRAMVEAQALERIEGRLRELQGKQGATMGDVIDGYAVSAGEAVAAH